MPSSLPPLAQSHWAVSHQWACLSWYLETVFALLPLTAGTWFLTFRLSGFENGFLRPSRPGASGPHYGLGPRWAAASFEINLFDIWYNKIVNQPRQTLSRQRRQLYAQAHVSVFNSASVPVINLITTRGRIIHWQPCYGETFTLPNQDGQQSSAAFNCQRGGLQAFPAGPLCLPIPGYNGLETFQDFPYQPWRRYAKPAPPCD